MKIVLTGGGTAGHCMPNLALLPRLRTAFEEIEYIGSKEGMEGDLARSAGLPYYEVECCKLRRAFTLKNLAVPFSLLRGRAECVRLLKRLAPDVVFSKGGYVALPVALACKRLNIPLVCHESDCSLGLANRLCVPFASRVLTAFPMAEQRVKNAQTVGAPLRENLFRAKKSEGLARYGFSGKKPVLLVLGGSLGAESINRALLQILDDLLEKFDVLHLVGKKNALPLPKKQGYVWRSFEPEMEYAYATASFALSRAGANALFEITALKLPALVIPLPSGRGDQKQNAAYFEKMGAVMVLQEEELHTKSLYDELLTLKRQAPALRRAMEALPQKNANATVVEILAAVAKEYAAAKQSSSKKPIFTGQRSVAKKTRRRKNGTNPGKNPPKAPANPH